MSGYNEDVVWEDRAKILVGIQQLIDHHKSSKQEVYMMLEELSQIDEDKISYQEYNALNDLKVKYEEEMSLRSSFITDLEDLL